MDALGTSARPFVLGAVAYDPKVVTIWEGFADWFARQGFVFDYVLYSNYEAQVEAHLAGDRDATTFWLTSMLRQGAVSLHGHPPADRTRGSATGEWRQHGQLHLGSNPREDREPVKRIAVDAPENLCRRICGWLRGRWSRNGRQPVRRAKCKRWPDQGVSGAATQMEPIVGGRRDGVVVVGRVMAPAWR